MIPYILYASLILTACFIFYKLLLQKETFFHLNRFVLLTCMMLAFVLPVIHVPQQMSFRKGPVSSGISSPEASLELSNTASPAEQKATPALVDPVQKNQLLNFDQAKQ